ncbi:MAG TPA: CDP-alcohol phosphatidyltransferase family protein [Dehalococcoidia bacterium]|nr:CDP-alcohol phosphatidyltransferase family protein [Dehalococcoidia bacterium]
MAKLVGIRKTVGYYLAESPARLLARTPVTPNTITWIGFMLAVGGAVLIAVGQLLAAGLVVLIAAFFDIIDGALARLTGRATPFGAVLDSTLDRLSESVLLLGILVLYAGNGNVYPVLLVAVTLVFSLLVSYIRARAETLGLDCQVGLFTRGERVILLVLGLCLSPVAGWALPVALLVILVFSFVTVIQRLVYVWQKTRVV